jgi:pimeloyl-ACP methyl ester carboxylesterase
LLFLILLLIPVLLIAGALLYQAAGKALDRRRFPPPGKLVRCGGTKLHVRKTGEGTPTVVLEAGVAGSSLGWALLEPLIAEFSTVISYDRAGLGWSGPARQSRSVKHMNSELQEVLSSYPGPFVLVGHSFGGLLVRGFAAHYPELVRALVLVDPVSIETWTSCSGRDRLRLERGVALSRRGSLLAGVGVVRTALSLLVSGSRILPKLIGRTAAGRASPVIDRFVRLVRLLPEELWPVIQAHWSDQRCFSAMANYLHALPSCAEEVATLQIPNRIPVFILSAATATEAERAERDTWVSGRAGSWHMRVDNSGHWIQLENPRLVADTVREATTASA